MPDTTEPPDHTDPDVHHPEALREEMASETKGVGNRLAWFFGIAAASGIAFACAAGLLRWLILH